MKQLSKALAISAVALLGWLTSGTAQVQQSISFNLTVYNQTETGVHAVRVTTRDIIEHLAGTNVPGGKLWLVMPTDPDLYNITGTLLRVTDAHGNIIARTTTDTFNMYQAAFSQSAIHTVAWNQFSLALHGLAWRLSFMARRPGPKPPPGRTGRVVSLLRERSLHNCWHHRWRKAVYWFNQRRPTQTGAVKPESLERVSEKEKRAAHNMVRFGWGREEVARGSN